MTGLALWLRGFRPFFLGAVLVAIASMALWLLVYQGQLPLALGNISMFQWHAHEMLYGYTLGVIAGFLLTAAWNWTGMSTASGTGLALIFAFWAAARVAMLFGTTFLLIAAIADLAFILGLGIAVGRPVLKARQSRQATVLLILALLATANLLFYVGAAGYSDWAAHVSIRGGLYLVLGMVLFMGRRVIPFFTQRGVGYPVTLKNERWNDVATFVLFPAFLLSEVLLPHHWLGALLAAALFILNSLRVNGWHTLGIWKKPLLWGLFAAFVMINLGFLMRGLQLVTAVPDFLPIHAFAVGGIGIVTVSMMARVTLGHTGRNVHEAPPITVILLGGMVLTTIVRILFPLVDAARYQFWITVAGILWIACFILFAVVFIPMLVSKRVDEK